MRPNVYSTRKMNLMNTSIKRCIQENIQKPFSEFTSLDWADACKIIKAEIKKSDSFTCGGKDIESKPFGFPLNIKSLLAFLTVDNFYQFVYYDNGTNIEPIPLKHEYIMYRKVDDSIIYIQGKSNEVVTALKVIW